MYTTYDQKNQYEKVVEIFVFLMTLIFYILLTKSPITIALELTDIIKLLIVPFNIFYIIVTALVIKKFWYFLSYGRFPASFISIFIVLYLIAGIGIAFIFSISAFL